MDGPGEDLKLSLTLPSELIDRCRKYGEQMVRDYAMGKSAASLAVSSHGAERDPILQGRAKMSECAFALWLGRDPLVSVKWAPGTDSGWDIVHAAARIDVKSIGLRDRFLIWPYRKTSFFSEKDFTAFVAVRESEPEFEIVRWVDKLTFFEKHKVEGRGGRLHEGTWFMDIDELFTMNSLVAYFRLMGTW